MKQWYTLHTKPNAEYQVAAALQQRGIQTYLPELESPKGQERHKKKPFFPCYLFAKVDLELVGISSVKWTPGLRRVVAFDNNPVPLADEVIDLIRHRVGEFESNGGLAAHIFKPGDTVRIASGPFRDMLAIFDGPTTPTQRVQVLLNFLGASRMQVNVTNLKEASQPIDAPLSRRRRTRGRGRHVREASM